MLHPSALKAHEIAEALGAVVIPVYRSKKPKYRYWRSLDYTKCRSKELLSLYDEHTNIGIVQGVPSSGLISIDFDADEPLKEFLELNPDLKCTMTTSAARGANLWFKIQGNYPPLTRLKRGGKIWAEWRSTGAYTVLHGLHADGMPYKSHDKKPLRICHEHIRFPDDVLFKASIERNSSATLNAAPVTTPLHPALLHHCTTSSIIMDSADSPNYGAGAVSTQLSPKLILSNMKSREEALNKFKAENPHLHRLYLKLIDQKYHAQPHQRNDFLNEAVPFLYRAVAPKLILPLVEFFYIVHKPIFHDSLSQHTKEAKALLRGVSETYLSSLSPDEQELLQALVEGEQIAYRILRDLAMRVTDDSPLRLFFMSADEMGLRLGISSMQAHRILKDKLAKPGIIQVLENGVRRAKGQRGIATTYRWNVAHL